ncbi:MULTISPECIES: hypothetical protein [Sporosarcina]|uniref:Uncharacterized protein n=2 Tax=Sporosarcina newyorkensis TaxID=759851 RepID=A0A1T4XES2_9BACL|nr:MULTISPECIES: hypothetical protein [Sporosarcina]EGQ27709.1 hypothetical protein HMPREF9372_0333 [Sporosarcina newyorkensis 2681]MBY0220969.1 glycosyltransferase [Sporosarcina aquimarina]SKA88060.1 hypothetical protein SAMN04244570_0618 [Sporosarcina newyorkensis]
MGVIQEDVYVKRAGKFVKVKNAVYRVMDKFIDESDKPGEGFGKQIFNWQDDKPLFYEVSYTKRLKSVPRIGTDLT